MFGRLGSVNVQTDLKPSRGASSKYVLPLFLPQNGRAIVPALLIILGSPMRKPEMKSNPVPARASDPVMAQSRFPVWLMAALLALMTVALYWPAMRCDFVNFDDPDYVTENPHVQGGLTLEGMKWAFSNPVVGNWHPLTVLSHTLDCQLFGLKPWGHHLTSVLLHALNTVLVFLLLRRLTGALWRSALVAALFGLHPLHVESVAWMAERKDVLSTGFGLLALVFYARYAQKRSRAEPSSLRFAAPRSRESGAGNSGSALDLRHSTLDYGFALLFFALGLMSKPMLVTWPFVMLLLDFWPLQRVSSFKFSVSSPGTTPASTLNCTWNAPACDTDFVACSRKRSSPEPARDLSEFGSQLSALVFEKLPFFGLAAVMSVVTYVVQRHSGAMDMVQNLPLGARIGNALISYCRYLGKLFWPADLAIFYPHPGYWPMAQVLLAGGLLLGITVLFIVKGGRYPFLLMGWLWYCGMLVPVIGLVQVGDQAMADRYTYISLLGVLILAVWGAYELTRHWRYQVIVLSVAGCAVIVLCLGMTRQQLGYWRDSETLFRHALEVTENNCVAHYTLGNALLKKGQTVEAIRQFEEAIRLKPDYADAHNNLGVALNKKGQTAEAIRQFEEAIRLKPNYAEAHNNLGNTLDRKGQTAEAIRQFQEAIRLKPDLVEAHNNLGNAFLGKGLTDEAIRQFEEAIHLKPDLAEAHYNLGIALDRKDRTAEAISQFQEAIRLKPDYAEAHNNLGVALNRKGQIDEVISHYQEAIRLKPDYAEAHNNLGIAFGMKGQTEEAIGQFQGAIRLKPDYAEAHFNLGNALGMKSQTDEAIRQFQGAIRLKPDYADAHNNLGTALLKKDQIAEAINQYQEAIRLKPDSAEAHYNLGNALDQKGQTAEAIRHYQEAIRLKPDFVEARHNLARALTIKNAPAGR
jgi:tetratricopeptide (TPR) repeat protein